MKKLSLVLTMVLFCLGISMAQRTVTGTVTDDSGEALIGASVLVKGSATGTVTDIDGSYSLDVPGGEQTLVFSYTGYATKDVVTSASNVLDVVLSEGLELTEVVVTGLGIKKEKKALGYGVSTISNDQLQGRAEGDVARILRGKATGVDITQTSGLAGSGTNVIIRGYSSITGSNQPLFVVDGIPFNTETNTDQGFGSGGATASSRFLDLDPNSIAEISILKGLSATVLYGEAGRNGVVLITTKNGEGGSAANKGLEISLTQTIAKTDISNVPDYQNTFGNGFGGGFGWFFSNWGAAFDDLNPSSYGNDFQGINADGQVLITHPLDQAQYNDDVPEFIGAEYPYQPFESVENFFESGLTSQTSVSIESKLGANSSMSATYSYLSDEGFTPDLADGGGPSNFLRKHNFGLGASTQLQNGLRLKGSFNYVDSDRLTPLTGQAFGGDGNGLFAALLFTPRSVDLLGLPFQSPIDGSNLYYRRGAPIQNPLWTLNNTGQAEDVNRFFSTLEAGYDINSNISLLYRIGVDQYSQNNSRFINKGGSQVPDGEFVTSERKNRITDQILNVVYNQKITEDLNIDGIVGVNLRSVINDGSAIISTQQFVFDLFTHQNFITQNAVSGGFQTNTFGAYANVSLGYRNFLYATLSGRNDWTSLLERENRSVFYPSASISFIPTEAVPSLQNSNVVNYLKLRFGYGTSAGYPIPYQTRTVLAAQTNSFVTNGGSVLNTNSLSNTLGNPNLRPELHREFEGGIEAKFLNNRVGIDLSLYTRESSDLIIAQDLDPATGFTSTTVNGAELENRGIELGIDLTPLKGRNFSWDITLNLTRNESEVTRIADGVDQIQIRSQTADFLNPGSFAGFFGDLGNYAIVGQPYGIMQGSSFQKDEDGNFIVDGQGNYQADSGIGIIGDPNPDYTANWINNISYKGISFGFQWQYIKGGDIFSSTVQSLLARGNTVDTDVDRFVPIVLPGVSADGTPNDLQTYIGDSFFRAYFFADEGGVFDATSIRLREISLSYVFPDALIEKTPFGRIGLTFSGQNLWYNAPNFPEGINYDPEVLSLGVGNGRGFDFRTAPTAQKLGVTLNVTF